MARYAVSGCKISISTAPVAEKDVDFQASDFTGLTWTEINEWITMGDIGDEANDITSQIIGLNRDKHAKGTRNMGAMENVHNWDATNAGQIAIKAAEKTSFNYGIKIEMNDKGPGTGATNSIFYFMGLVTSARHVGGGANTIRGLRAVVQPNSNLVEVAATAGT